VLAVELVQPVVDLYDLHHFQVVSVEDQAHVGTCDILNAQNPNARRELATHSHGV
jgi:hypothetical protein